MRLFIVYNYKARYSDLKGTELTDALIRDCLGEMRECSDVRIHRTAKGKPYVDGAFISVSHSADTFALAVSDAEVGLDIQYARNTKADRIAARFFTEEEADCIAAGAENTAERFFQIWTRKEAFCKFTGLGMEQIMRKDGVLGREDISFTDLRLEDGCFCAVCAARQEGAADEIQISYRK